MGLGITKFINSIKGLIQMRINLFKYFLFILIFFTVNNSLAQFGLQNEHVNIESYFSFDKVYQESELKLAVKINIEDKWHVNSNKPNEYYLIPPELIVQSDYLQAGSIASP